MDSANPKREKRIFKEQMLFDGNSHNNGNIDSVIIESPLP